MGIWPDEIMTPRHVHNASSQEDYRLKQKIYIQQGRAARPELKWCDPWLSLDHPEVLIAGGKWLVFCGCGNYPSVDPGWRLACCFECGAIYENLEIPYGVNEIERLLVKRPNISNRAWIPPQSIEDLQKENREHGLEA